MAVVHTAGADRRQPGVHQQQAAAAGGRRQDAGAQARLRDGQQDQRVLPHARHPAAGRSAERSRRRGARASTRATRSTRCKNVAEWFSSVRGRRKAILFVSEGIDYDITTSSAVNGSNHQGASMVLDATRDAIARGDALERVDLRHRSARPDRSRRRVDRDRSVPRRHVARHRPGLAAERAAAVAGQPAHAVGRDRRLRRRQPERFLDRVRAHRRRTTARTTCWPTTRPTRRPGRTHKIEVRVTRPGLTVRARKGYVTPKKATPRGDERRTDRRTPGGARSARQPDAGQRPDDARVRGAVQGHGAERVGAARRRDCAAATSSSTPNDKILLSYVAIDANGKISGGNTDTMTMTNLKPETKTRIEQTGLRMLNRIGSAAGPLSAARRGARYRPAATSARCSTTSTCPTSPRRRSA